MLTAGQKGDAPQAAALIEGLPAEVVIADTAYDTGSCAKTSPPKRCVIPNNPSRALKYPLDKHLHAPRHLVQCCSKLKQFSALLPQTMLLADRGYDADWISELVPSKEHGRTFRENEIAKNPI